MADPKILVISARVDDGPAIAAIHLNARTQAMPALRRPHTDEETRDHLIRAVGNGSLGWWTIRRDALMVAFMLIHGEDLDDLYVSPPWRGRELGSALLEKAKTLSAGRLQL